MKKKYNQDLKQIDAAWKKLEPLLEGGIETANKKKLFLSGSKFLAAAAVFVLVTTIGILFIKDYRSMLVYSTKYGETSKVILPDSSVILLNGNTSLSYRKHWSDTGDREVTINGEAYFSIKHTKTNQKFFVRMDDHSSVEVLGTEFNVSKRKEETMVVLNSGKIKFHMNSDEKGSGIVTMKPGDLVAFQSQKRTYTKKVVDPEIYSSWKSSRLVFEKTKLKDVLRLLHDTYGLTIIVEKPALLNMRISGSAPTQNIDQLITGLSEIFHLDFKKNGDTLMVTSN